MNRTLALLVALILVCSARAGEPVWLTDLDAALAQAKAENKSVLMLFHGSDWCPPCIALKKQVFSTPEFAEYAARALVLVDVDFPNKKAQAEEQKQRNLALKERFNVGKKWREGFPTVVLLNQAGETVYQEKGYRGGGPSEVLPKLQRHTEP